MRHVFSSGSGFTISEVAVVIVVMGILALVAVPVFVGIRRASQENAAIHNAKMINAARDGYALTVPSALASWASAADDRSRLALLVSEDLLAGGPDDYLAMDGEYSVTLGADLRARTTLTKAGHAITY